MKWITCTLTAGKFSNCGNVVLLIFVSLGILNIAASPSVPIKRSDKTLNYDEFRNETKMSVNELDEATTEFDVWKGTKRNIYKSGTQIVTNNNVIESPLKKKGINKKWTKKQFLGRVKNYANQTLRRDPSFYSNQEYVSQDWNDYMSRQKTDKYIPLKDKGPHDGSTTVKSKQMQIYKSTARSTPSNSVNSFSSNAAPKSKPGLFTFTLRKTSSHQERER